jgi:hypothetical protein
MPLNTSPSDPRSLAGLGREGLGRGLDVDRQVAFRCGVEPIGEAGQADVAHAGQLAVQVEQAGVVAEVGAEPVAQPFVGFDRSLGLHQHRVEELDQLADLRVGARVVDRRGLGNHLHGQIAVKHGRDAVVQAGQAVLVERSKPLLQLLEGSLVVAPEHLPASVRSGLVGRPSVGGLLPG